MPESLYRARLLAERDDAQASDGNGEPIVLPWLGWDSGTMLLTDIRNTLEALTVAQSGDKKAKPSLVYSPSYKPESQVPHGKVDAASFRRAMSMLGMGVN